VSAVRNGAGQIVCAINADATTANDDPACTPFDPFGNTQPSQQVIDYVSTRLEDSVRNKQDDFLATIGGELITLPAGKLQFSAAYEHRRESAVFTPGEAELLGLAGFTSSPESGRYHTNEYSGELLIPLVGGDFTLPLVQKLELSGSFRHVDNSLAGKNNVWGVGGRWTVGAGITLRGSRSRNFSAPTLDQQLAPSSVNPGNPAQDPCDRTLINSGPNPSVRLANCQALFAANPAWGPLASFNDPAINTGLVALTETGNPNLRNEVSNTLTLGVQFEPPFIPGLSASADYIKVDLTDAISFFGINDFLSACYDISPQPGAICATFARDPATGFLVTGTEETFNAGLKKFRGELYKLNYHLPLSRLFARGRGALDFHVEALHNRFFETSVTGFDRTRSDGTVNAPDWRVRFDLSYSRGPFKAFYSIYYLPSAKSSFTATIETTPFPVIASNTTHTVSVQYDLRHLTLRAGVDNLFDKAVSIPTRTYGDLYGRRVFVGARVHF
jgi:outer membrane receptor protein involved in Fe transport